MSNIHYLDDTEASVVEPEDEDGVEQVDPLEEDDDGDDDENSD